MGDLSGKTLFITGASRGIGLAIALRAARDGANVAFIAKTGEPHPSLPGTIHTAAEAIEAAGGHALPMQADVRDEAAVALAVGQTIKRFGGIDVCVNNASAIHLAPVRETVMSRYDLMMRVGPRGTLCASQACLHHLLEADNPHILTLAPPINLDPRWFKGQTAYTMAKYGMSMAVVGMAAELAEAGVAVNALWPRTVIATAALALIPQVRAESCRKPEIVADAAHAILTRPSREHTGCFYIDEEVLREEGVTDFDPYAVKPGEPLLTDLFLD
ncbi:MAG: NAD(P)-dependent oxidoreductase [Nitrospirota bacterium]|jgi:citronellol/citronellal dehydrogenase